MGRTHMLLGVNLLWIFEAVPPAVSPLSDSTAIVLAVAGAATGALVPDLDATTSLLQNVSVGGVRPLILPGRLANRHFGHRGFLHSFLALGIWSFLVLPTVALSISLWLGLTVGYLSHLLGDACTRSGLRLLFPNRRVIYLLPRPWRMVTGSQAEEAIFALLSVAGLTLMLRHLFFFGP